MLSFIEVEAAFRVADNDSKSRQALNLFFVRDAWDNYRELSGVDESLKVLPTLNRLFKGVDQGCKYFRPFGDFKDFIDLDLTVESIYETWVERAQVVLGDAGSIQGVALRCVRRIDKIIHDGRVTRTVEDLVEGFSLMLYRSAQGVMQEVRVLEVLMKAFDSSTLRVKAAPAWMEGWDVDGIFVVNGEEKFFSIKNFKALGAGTIMNKRLKGKVKPLLYVGFKSDGDEKLTVLDPEGQVVTGRAVLDLLY